MAVTRVTNKELVREFKAKDRVAVGAAINTQSISRNTYPSASMIVDDSDGFMVTGTLYYQDKSEATRLLDVLASTGVGGNSGVRVPNPDNSKDSSIGFYYKPTNTEWKKQEITIAGTTFTLYTNWSRIGVVKELVYFAILFKDKTSDSESFYEDIVNKPLSNIDLRKLFWLLAIGHVTGVKPYLTSVDTEQEGIIINAGNCSIQSSNSIIPKSGIINSDSVSINFDLSLAKDIKVATDATTYMFALTFSEANSKVIVFLV